MNILVKKKNLHAFIVWKTFKMDTMGDYHDLHLKTDVLLSANVFEKFINAYLEYYGLNSCHSFRSPGLRDWNEMNAVLGCNA